MIEWSDVSLEMREFIREWLMENEECCSASSKTKN
jgi:hypothetical protein